MSWQPLLEDTLKDRALESVQGIIDDLGPVGRERAGDPSLAGGTAGLALLHGYLAQTKRWQNHGAIALRCIQDATAALAETPAGASLYSGLTGVGWALAHLQSQLPGMDGEADVAEMDETLQEHLSHSPWTETYDLIDGLVGLGVYALERLSPGVEAARLTAVACLERVIDHLADTAERSEGAITWASRPEWLPPDIREKYPARYYNLGLAHGVPGVIALLGQICAAGVAAAKARPLLDGAARWLLAYDQPGGFGHWVERETPDKPARLAWCYGDPGIAAALLAAARKVEEADWERRALAIARRAVERPPEDSGVVDAGLCHGAAGLGHLFNRLFQATGEPWLAEAGRSWFARTLAMARPGRGIGGYEAWGPADGGNLTWAADPGLLTGAAGIALALLAATTPIEPAWDRMLLVAIPLSDQQR